jgi:hypothetical protein
MLAFPGKRFGCRMARQSPNWHLVGEGARIAYQLWEE